MTILHTKLDAGSEEYLLRNSQYDNSDIDDIFNSAYFFEEPYMQISKLQATALQFFISTIGVRNIIEVGTFVGYSAFSMAKILDEKVGNLVTLEKESIFYEQARKNQYEYNRAYEKGEKVIIGAINNIEFFNVDAKDYFHNISFKEASNIDMVFLDGDKENYKYYLKWCVDNLRKGAYFMIDNALFKGGVVSGSGIYTESIRGMTHGLKMSNAFDYFFLPVGDYMIIARKK